MKLLLSKTGKRGWLHKAKSLEEVLDQVKIDTDIDFTAKSVDYVSGFNNFIAGYSGSGVTTSTAQLWVLTEADKDLNQWIEKMEKELHTNLWVLEQWSRNFSAETFHVDISYTTEQIKIWRWIMMLILLNLEMQFLEVNTQSIQRTYLVWGCLHGWQHHYNMHTLKSSICLNFSINTTDAPNPTGLKVLLPGTGQ